MSLLKRALHYTHNAGQSDFTFHYVSIKTVIWGLYKREKFFFTFHYVSIKTSTVTQQDTSGVPLHSTMSLLKLVDDYVSTIVIDYFTFHYVSIKTHLHG